MNGFDGAMRVFGIILGSLQPDFQNQKISSCPVLEHVCPWDSHASSEPTCWKGRKRKSPERDGRSNKQQCWPYNLLHPTLLYRLKASKKLKTATC